MVGGGLADDLRGGAGVDTPRGLAGDDVLRGNGGDDTLDGGKGSDVLIGRPGRNILTGGEGADLFILPHRGVDGLGAVIDTITDFTPSEGDRIALATGDYYTDDFAIDLDRLILVESGETPGNFVLSGDPAARGADPGGRGPRPRRRGRARARARRPRTGGADRAGQFAPMARDDAYEADHGAPLTVDAASGLLANESDPDGPGDLLSIVSGGAAAKGILTIATDGGFA